MNAAIALPPERAGYPASPELAELRRGMAAAIAGGVWDTARPPVETDLGGRRALRFAPVGESRGRVLHFHGGGFRIGEPAMAGPFAAALADRCGVEVIVPQYRLAPEHPFPGGLLDARAVLSALRSESMNVPLIVCGDSAGGGLAAGLGALTARDGPRIDALVLLSPWLDLTVSAPSYVENAVSDPMFSAEAAGKAAELYLQGLDPRDALASPLHAPLESFPPTLISVGMGEVLRDDALRFHHRLLAHGVASHLCAVAEMEHTAVVRGLALPGAAHTFEAIAAFVGAMVQK